MSAGQPGPHGVPALRPSQLHVRMPRQSGYQQLAAPGDVLGLLTIGRLCLQPGDRYEAPVSADETALIILSGKADVTAGDHRWDRLGERDDVFTGQATAVYIPPNISWTVVAVTALEAIVTSAPIATAYPPGAAAPVLVKPQDVIVHQRGRPGFAREVHDIIADNVPASRLVIGETFNAPGEWSSYPPHKHDTDRGELETVMEEAYYFRTDPPQGFGAQMIYTADGTLDFACRVQDGDLTLLPRGYHPVAAAPGYRLYYLWVLAGHQGRTLRPADDPAHAWVKDPPSGA